MDYAHTPDALQKVLSTIRDIREKNEKIITVVGCGGNRDKSKRPLMGSIAGEYSDHVIFTSDNPRSEDPDTIIQEMIQGVKLPDNGKVLSIAKREDAIKTACKLAQQSDIILIAGKGHEKYQEINGTKYPFEDKKVIEKCFKELNV